MLNVESPLIQDLDATSAYCNAALVRLAEYSNLEVDDLPEAAISALAMGTRHMQRTVVDAALRGFKVIAMDLDGKIPNQLEKLLDSLSQATSARPALIRPVAHQHLLLARTLAQAAGLPVMPEETLQDWHDQCQSAKAMLMAFKVISAEIVYIREWCIQNLDG